MLIHRPKSRIRPLLDRLAAVWEESPDLRLGQMFHIVQMQTTHNDIFYTEDEELLKIFEFRLTGKGSP